MRTLMNRSLLPGSALLATCVLAAGCSSRTYIAAQGSTPPHFTHVFITTQAVWLNTSATAGPDDGGWQQFPLTTPSTIDLVAASNGTFQQIIGDLKLSPGTFKQILLMPVTASTAVTTSAQQAGATFNQEVDYVDSAGNAHQVALQIANPDKGILIPGSLSVPFATGTPALGTTTGTTGTTTPGTTTTTSTTGSSTPLRVCVARMTWISGRPGNSTKTAATAISTVYNPMKTGAWRH